MFLPVLGIFSFVALGYALYVASAPEKTAMPSKPLIN